MRIGPILCVRKSNMYFVFVCICLQASIIRFVSAETFLNHGIIKFHVHRDSPKNWFSYIRMLLHNYLKFCFAPQTKGEKIRYFTNGVKKLMDRIKIIRMLSNTTQITMTHNKCFSSDTVTNPLGRVMKQDFSDMFHKSNQYFKGGFNEYYFHTHSWIFTLDKQLRLNITFTHIRIVINNLDTCYIGNVTVRTFDPSENSKFQFVYCGILSNIPNYPKMRNVDIIVSIRPYVQYIVIFSYGVIDPDRTISLRPQIYKTNKLEWFVHFPTTNKYLQFLHLKVEKYNVIALSFANHIRGQYEVFDGPGRRSKALILRNQTDYITSTFQCVIFLLVSINRLDRKQKVNHLKFLETSKNNVEERFLAENRTLKLDNAQTCDTDDRICVIELSTKNEFHFNISIMSLYHTYTNDIICIYGGLTVYDRKRVPPNEITTRCQSKNNDYEHRPIYSNSSRILSVIYEYPEYGNLSLLIKVSTTDCTVLEKNPCLFQFPCFRSPYHAPCQKFGLYEIYGTNPKSHFGYDGLHIPIQGCQCVVVQFAAVLDLFFYKLFAFVVPEREMICSITHTVVKGYDDLTILKKSHSIHINYTANGIFTGKSDSISNIFKRSHYHFVKDSEIVIMR